MKIFKMDKKELKDFYQRYADLNGFLLQPDPILLDHVLEGLLQREKAYGLRFCPCRRVLNNPDEDRKIVCPCFFHKDEIEQDGHCKCLLFLKKF